MLQASQLTRLSSVIPVISIDRLSDAEPIAQALVAGGIPVIEVTLRTPAALESIARISANVPEITVGAGTLKSRRDVSAAVEAGADFLVSPGFTEELLAEFIATDRPFLVGASTPGEVMRLLDSGITAAKYFPAEALGGVRYLEALAAPFPEFRFCPTGGINAANAGAYLRLPNVFSVGGSWMVEPEAVRRRAWSDVQARVREAANLR